MNDADSVNMALILVLGGFIIILASIALPVYGYNRKRLKGMALGCLLQPVACGVAISLLCMIMFGIDEFGSYRNRKAAMVTVRTAERGTYGTDTLTWYLKPDEECYVEYKRLIKEKPEATDSLYDEDDTDCFDIIRLDSLKDAVSVDDRIIVRFDLKNQKATATNFDEPVEVVSVDWEKVKAFFSLEKM